MFRDTVTVDQVVDQVVDLLNEMAALDCPAVGALIVNRVPCNEALAGHPTVPVHAQYGGYYVGLLDVLNGLFGPYEGAGVIVPEFDEDKGEFLGFRRRDKPSPFRPVQRVEVLSSSDSTGQSEGD